MRYISHIYDYSITPMAKILIAANAAVWFFLVVIIQKFFMEEPLIFQVFGLVPEKVFSQFWLWQIFTYIFLHASGVFHILMNMLILWMFGSELEKLWGSRFFLVYYLSCGAGAALIYLLCAGVYTLILNGDPLLLQQPVIGASGAMFGLLLAYGLIYSERVVYLMGLFPIKARHLVILIAAIDLVSLLDSGFGSPVAHLAHLGGLLSGLLFLKFWKAAQRLYIKKWLRSGRPRLRILRKRGAADEDADSHLH